jgi:hypothetical protein
MKRLVTALIALVFVSNVALASDQWDGLWQIVTYSGDRPGSIYHLAISGSSRDSLGVYNEIGKALEVGDFKISEESILLVVTPAPKPLPTALDAQRDGDRLTGQWTFSHPQYGETTGRLAGRKIVDLPPSWLPFAKLQRDQEQALIDLISPLHKVQTVTDFAQFVETWDKLVEPDYYFLLYRQLYTDPAESERKPAELGKVFDQLRDPVGASRWEAWGTDFLHHVEGAKALLRISSAPFYVLRPVGPAVEKVTLWSKFLSETDKSRLCCSMVPFLEQDYLVFNPLAWPASEETALLVTKEIVLSLLPAPDSDSAAEEIFRQGLALHLALELNSRPAPACSPERLQQLKKHYGTLPTLGREAITSEFVPGTPPAAPGLLLACDFIRSLSSGQSRTQLIGMNETQIKAALASYLAD